MAKSKRKPRLDDEVSRLYSLPLAEFTAERDALARRMREEGDRDAADQVRALKKPKLPAWAINRAVRTDPDAAKELIAAGERLNEAQGEALKGEGHAQLREAMAGQQSAVEQMMRAVEQALDRGSRSSAILDRARETLRAVAGDEELREQFGAGLITRDREAVGFGGVAAGTAAPRRAAKPKPAPDPDAGRRREAMHEEKRAARALAAAVKRVEHARRRLEHAQEALDAAQEAHDQAEQERSAREAELAEARLATVNARSPG